MTNNSYSEALQSLLMSEFIPAGYKITKNIVLDPIPESSKYDAMSFGMDNKNIVYRKGKVTPDRPGAFLAVWQRPSASSVNNKPIPLKQGDLDYLFVHVQEHSNLTTPGQSLTNPKCGLFIFPVSVLIEKGIVLSSSKKGKTGFRVFPPWSQDRGLVATKVFSESGKKTQRWQLPYFIKIDENGLINSCELNKVFSPIK